MIRKLFVALALFASAAAPLRADLKYTTHSEMKPSTVTDAKPVDPMLTMVAGQFKQMMLPNGPADTVYIISDKGMRVEYVKGGMNGQAEGTVVLALANGDFVQLSPKDKTYWKTTQQAVIGMAQSAGIQPQVIVKPTSEAATVAGVRARRSDVEVNVPLPIPAEMRAQMPPGFPSAISMSGEAWLATTPFEKYIAMSGKVSQAIAGMGFAEIAKGGIVMRQVMRSPFFGGEQVETVVTKIGEEAAPPAAFTIPADYKEVPAPIK